MLGTPGWRRVELCGHRVAQLRCAPARLLKRGTSRTYVSVEPFHLSRYLDEPVRRYKNRKLTDGKHFNAAVSGTVGNQLTFDELTGKVSRSSETLRC